MNLDINVLFFGPLQDWIGSRLLKSKIKQGFSIQDYLEDLERSIGKPLLESFQIHCAVNEVFVEKDLVLKNGDTLALMTPVSGG